MQSVFASAPEIFQHSREIVALRGRKSSIQNNAMIIAINSHNNRHLFEQL